MNVSRSLGYARYGRRRDLLSAEIEFAAQDLRKLSREDPSWRKWKRVRVTMTLTEDTEPPPRRRKSEGNT